MRVFWVLLFVLAFTAPVCSNPPQDITLKIFGSKLDVFVIHPSSNPAQHFIKTIDISLNGTKIITQIFSTQAKDGQTAVYFIPGLKKGDKIIVSAVCSVYGDLQKKVLVP